MFFFSLTPISTPKHKHLGFDKDGFTIANKNHQILDAPEGNAGLQLCPLPKKNQEVHGFESSKFVIWSIFSRNY